MHPTNAGLRFATGLLKPNGGAAEWVGSAVCLALRLLNEEEAKENDKGCFHNGLLEVEK
jgi:hypothetical protein